MGRRMLALAIVVVVVPVVLPLVSRSDAAAARAHRLAGIDSWGYQLQGLEEEGAIDALVEAPYELLVLEPTRTEQGSEAFDAAGMVEALHENDKLVASHGAATRSRLPRRPTECRGARG